jgi:hypothetical protein
VKKCIRVLALAGAASLVAPAALAQSASSAGAPAPTQGAADPAATSSSSTSSATSADGTASSAMSDNARLNAAATNPDNLPAGDPNRMLMREVGSTYSLGWRFWYQSVPGFIVGLFAKVLDGWGGGGGVATGPEFVYRNGAVEIMLGLQYAGYYAGYGTLHGLGEMQDAAEQIKVDLWSIQVTSHFMYGIRANRFFEFQIGAGIGAGGMGGTLNRYQAYETSPGSGRFAACALNAANSMAPGMGAATVREPCNQAVNNHFAMNVDAQGRGTGGYAENNWVGTGGGFVPLIIPWLSLPHMAFHIRPHRNFDFRLEGGYSLIGFYGGGTAHYVF